MNTTLIRTLAAVALGGGVALSAASAMAGGSDTFNRPKLGATWVVTSGTLSISGDQLVGSSLGIGYLKAAASNTAGSAIVYLGGTDLEYGAVAVGNVAAGTNAFVKIQQQNGAGFDHAAFYTGDNGSGDFFALSSVVPSPAILDVSFCGTVAKMRITSAAGVQTYTHDYGSAVGPGGGLGTYGSVHLDNYIGFQGSCSSLAEAIPDTAMRHDVDLSRTR